MQYFWMSASSSRRKADFSWSSELQVYTLFPWSAPSVLFSLCCLYIDSQEWVAQCCLSAGTLPGQQKYTQIWNHRKTYFGLRTKVILNKFLLNIYMSFPYNICIFYICHCNIALCKEIIILMQYFIVVSCFVVNYCLVFFGINNVNVVTFYKQNTFNDFLVLKLVLLLSYTHCLINGVKQFGKMPNILSQYIALWKKIQRLLFHFVRDL